MSNVRVRFAPSPTGFFHIGSARTALFNWLYARKTGGSFVLRIEDTDKERNTTEALQVLLDGMRWLGLDWDEGPEKEGAYGPYFQSERSDIYDRHLQILRDKGLAYDKDGAVFFKISGNPQVIEDEVRGRVERTEEKDFVIYRSDGSPVFHFVNVVDDITMGITHVIRGEDHLSNTSKHTELFAAFDAPQPVFAHIPLILKQSGPGKMSKRDKGALVEDYEKQYFLPEAVRNYLCLLGWNPKDGREVMGIEEILQEFSFSGIQKAGAKFDERKMAFVNTEHLRALPLETFTSLARSVLLEKGSIDSEIDTGYLNQVMQLAQPKVNSLDTLGDYIGYCFDEAFELPETVFEKLSKKGDPIEKITQAKSALQSLAKWDEQTLDKAFQDMAQAHGEEKPFPWFPSVRWAISGAAGGPDLIPLLVVLGKEKVIARFERAIKQTQS
jgi:glutamyl/glutaminyl-tRNA synthetase